MIVLLHRFLSYSISTFDYESTIGSPHPYQGVFGEPRTNWNSQNNFSFMGEKGVLHQGNIPTTSLLINKARHYHHIIKWTSRTDHLKQILRWNPPILPYVNPIPITNDPSRSLLSYILGCHDTSPHEEWSTT